MTMQRPRNIRGRPSLFTAEQVRQFRAQYAELQHARDNYSIAALARRAGVSQASMQDLLEHVTYRWVS